MNPTTKVKDYYNEGQSKITVIEFTDGYAGLGVKIKNGFEYTIGFYEWLINQKYKVFKTIFNKDEWFVKAQDIVFRILEGKQPEEIIKYLAKSIEGGK